MDEKQFLQRVFDGYVNYYRKHNWHTSGNYSDMTQTEFSFFIDLGHSLGFICRREMTEKNWKDPRDLCWCENTGDKKQVFMYLERENENGRAIHTIEKMLNPENISQIPILVAIFGWINEATLLDVKSRIVKSMPPEKHFLVVAWVGENKDKGPFTLDGWVYAGRSGSERKAQPKHDDAGFWYAYFLNEWETI